MKLTMIVAVLFIGQSDSTYLLDSLPPSEPPPLWPTSVPFPKGMKPYQRATVTQSIFKLAPDRFSRAVPTIRRVLRTETLTKWQVNGGLEGIKDYRSDLYKILGQGFAWEWQEPITVANGHFMTVDYGRGLQLTNTPIMQWENGFKQSFNDGTVFVDNLSYKGITFETRVAEKQRGEWRRYVAFKDELARPPGYVGLKVQCASCHNNKDGPGTGDYGVALVSGADTVFSHPIKGLQP